ncbi:hypothetical protein SAMN04487843_11682 [Methylobacterium sp. ap11]|uniref:phosphoribosyltransferase-like protein n=1 Tax=Methylobacterium sp. ap11 TaxID=1761799 RepID=UPI0008C9CC60|nr:hypothetical protein [Methylobacterium sp. ap11]SEP41086.1 hypothetical protein SAMN04487843_11682 [Methylobacterium sp. ap11]
MINTLALNLIASVMKWDNEVATREYAWLHLMSSMKYDTYSDFRAGARFLESLVSWLRRFEEADRDVAYAFVKTRLVYISSAEMQRLIDCFVPETVTPYLRRVVAGKLGIRPYEVWKTPEASRTFDQHLRRCLFVGLSDGSRIDILRRANAGRLSQEQVVPMMNIDDDKWKGLAEDLRNDLGSEATFDDVYLIDDFTASGTTFIRFPEGKPKGKLAKFEGIVRDARARLGAQFPLSRGYTLHIHHYVSTSQAHSVLCDRIEEAEHKYPDRNFGKAIITEGMLLPPELRICIVDEETRKILPTKESDSTIIDLCERYYDHDLFKRLEKHCKEAGQVDMRFGYANCALPMILEHNTPNNSVPLLWAETDGKEGKPMRSLFLRRDRHG